MGQMRRIAIGSPVQQKPAILRQFLNGLYQQELDGIEAEYVFVDDNHDEASSALLRQFADAVPGVVLVPIPPAEPYQCDDTTHRWKESLVWRVAEIKDAIIEHALEKGHEGLFLVDSDIVLQPPTVRHLAELGCDIVSEVFWTKWQPDAPEYPQVWSLDQYDLIPRKRGEQLSKEEGVRRLNLVLSQLRTPGLYEVGGLGACTMISRRALEMGARFKEIPNISLWGEDRHFCVRAAALGIVLNADTEFPPLHIYRDGDLERVPAFAESCGLSLDAFDKPALVAP
ncbi:hypothetical protein [Krasilnikovia sp. MM14-A1259]|uniref:hypothetical protein n=1 Tax=Krasilnikovia sp. MM14-A1259 TaxID=3373539 RepID=UPI003822FA78